MLNEIALAVKNNITPIAQRTVEDIFSKYGPTPPFEKMFYDGGGLYLGLMVLGGLYVAREINKKRKIEKIKEPDYI